MRVRATVAYDGRPFHGFAPNLGVPTVSSALTDALGRVLGAAVVLTCAGRTDAGVHAWGQVVSFDAPDGADLAAAQDAVNKICGPALVIRGIEAAPAGFDARFDATARTYRYTILNRATPDPFLAATTWYRPARLAVAAMATAVEHLVGEHDFASFCRRHRRADGAAKSRVRVVRRAEWQRLEDDLVRFEIEAKSFCHQMVRAITGTVVEVGLGRRDPDDIPAILASRDRHAAGQPAPPHGLCLWAVEYA